VLNVNSQGSDVKIGWIIMVGQLLQGLSQCLLFVLVRLVEQLLRRRERRDAKLHLPRAQGASLIEEEGVAPVGADGERGRILRFDASQVRI